VATTAGDGNEATAAVEKQIAVSDVLPSLVVRQYGAFRCPAWGVGRQMLSRQGFLLSAGVLAILHQPR
jgi:hypothetical protein